MSYQKKIVGAAVGYALAGPAGALAGFALAGGGGDDPGYDMRDIPFGVHVEEEHQDDAVGRRWTLSFLSDVPADAYAMLRLLSDDGLSLPGRGPFRDVAGGFVASAEIRDRRCSVYVPFGAVRYASPKNISLEVAVVAAHATGHEPVGKAVLDASLPAPGVWRLADYLEPLIALGGRMMTPEQSVDEAALAQMVERLAEALGFDRDEWPGGALEAMVAHARDPLALKEAIHGARFRFPGLGRTELQALLRHATVTDEETDVSDEWRALLEAALAELD